MTARHSTLECSASRRSARPRSRNREGWFSCGIWGVPSGGSLDVWSQGQNRLTALSEFNQPNNTKPGAGLGLEWSSMNLGNTGFSLAARGSYTLNPDNNITDVTLGGLSTKYKSSTFTSDGLALGGGLGFTRGQMHLGFDYAYRNLGPLGGTNFISF